jgi:hypothetical protein
MPFVTIVLPGSTCSPSHPACKGKWESSECSTTAVGNPNQPLLGSTAQRKLDVGFANDMMSGRRLRYDWSQILVPGELKRNPWINEKEQR